jgi:peptidoglycan-associated lipoprotein
MSNRYSLLAVGLALTIGACAHTQPAHVGQAAAAPRTASAQELRVSQGGAAATAADHVPSLAPIHFDYDNAVIHPDDETRLAALGEYLVRHPGPALTVSGYCDERGTVEYNIALGDRRAQAARGYLMRIGVRGMRIQTISYGQSRPIAHGHDEAAWAQNRRDEFQLQDGQRTR